MKRFPKRLATSVTTCVKSMTTSERITRFLKPCLSSSTTSGRPLSVKLPLVSGQNANGTALKMLGLVENPHYTPAPPSQRVGQGWCPRPRCRTNENPPRLMLHRFQFQWARGYQGSPPRRPKSPLLQQLQRRPSHSVSLWSHNPPPCLRDQHLDLHRLPPRQIGPFISTP